MADIYSTTPGSAVADTVQQILQRRKDEQRQMVLDRLGLEKVRSDDRRQNTQLDLEKQRTNAQVAESQERVLGQQMDSYGGYGESDVPEEFVNSPLGQEMLRRQRIQKRPGLTPKVGTDAAIQPPQGMSSEQAELYAQQLESAGSPGTDMQPAGQAGPDRFVYAGKDKFQEQQDARNRVTSFAENEKDPGLKRVLAMQAAGIDTKGLEDYINPPSVLVMGPGRTPAEQKLKPNQQVLEYGYPPQATAASQPKVAQLYKDGKWVRSEVLSPPEAQAYADQGFEIRMGNTPQERPQQALLPPASVNGWRASLPRRSNENPQQWQARVQQSTNALLLNLNPNVPPTVKSFLGQAMLSLAERATSGKSMVPPARWAEAAKTGNPPITDPNDLATIEQFMMGIMTAQQDQ